MNLLMVVHIKSTYNEWKEVFDSNPAGRENFCDDSLTRVAKVDDNTAMIQIFDVDMQKMSEALNNPNAATAAATDDHVVKREVFRLEPMAPPS